MSILWPRDRQNWRRYCFGWLYSSCRQSGGRVQPGSAPRERCEPFLVWCGKRISRLPFRMVSNSCVGDALFSCIQPRRSRFRGIVQENSTAMPARFIARLTAQPFPRRAPRVNGPELGESVRRLLKRQARVRSDTLDRRQAHHDDQGQHDGIFHGSWPFFRQ